jgi:Protein of unknown function (DUF3225)
MMDIDLPEIVAEVTAAFERYEQAVVSNDVGTLDAHQFNLRHDPAFWEHNGNNCGASPMSVAPDEGLNPRSLKFGPRAIIPAIAESSERGQK